MAIAYTLHKAPFVFPIIGGRKVEHLHANIEALNIKLTPEQISEIENATPFDAGAPYTALVRPGNLRCAQMDMEADREIELAGTDGPVPILRERFCSFRPAAFGASYFAEG